jgi:hypothetical protein
MTLKSRRPTRRSPFNVIEAVRHDKKTDCSCAECRREPSLEEVRAHAMESLAEAAMSSMPSFAPDAPRVAQALQMFGDGMLGAPHSFQTTFESLGNELHIRHLVTATSKSPGSINAQLARLFSYVSFRLTELFFRLEQLNWMQRQFLTITGDDAAQWHNFAALCIKDFHIDVSAVMDAVAPAILQTGKAYDAAGEHQLPGFADIQRSGSPRAVNFRKQLGQEVIDKIDSAELWWPPIKRIRQDLAHREHTKIVFGSAKDGVLFQLYGPAYKPIVVHPKLLWSQGNNVADFRMYSAAVVAELLVFLDEMGKTLASALEFNCAKLTPSIRVGDFSFLIEPMKQLAT